MAKWKATIGNLISRSWACFRDMRRHTYLLGGNAEYVDARHGHERGRKESWYDIVTVNPRDYEYVC